MKTIKDDHLSIIARTYIHKQAPLLLVAVVAGFSFSHPDELLDESQVWEVVETCMGKNDYLDQGFPRPTGEVVLRARCYAPGGKSVPACPVSFQVGNLKKTLSVFGDRHWNYHAGIYTGISDPLPFTTMDISWENAFGGPGSSLNPRGKGLVKLADSSRRPYLPLPNIEDPADPVCLPEKPYHPRGFDYAGPGYIGMEDRNLQGTYNDDWLIHHWPYLPEDFDIRAAYAGPPDQRLKEGFFRGDEAVFLENLHPTQPRIQTALPGRRARIFLRSVKFDRPVFEERGADLDKIWLFPHLEAGIVIWHTMIPVGNEDADDVSHLLAFTERLNEAPQPESHYAAIIAADIAETAPQAAPAGKETGAGEATTTPSIKTRTLPPEKETADNGQVQMSKEWEDKMSAQEAELERLLREAGIAIPRREEVEKQSAPSPLAGLGPEEALRKQEAQQAEAEGKLRDALAQAGIDPEKLPPKPEAPPVRSHEELLAAMKEAGLEHTELFGMIVGMGAAMKALEQEKEALLVQATATGMRADVEKDTVPEAETPPEPPKTAQTRADVLARYAAGDDLSGLDLTGIDLSACKLPGACFRSTIMEKADLRGADLTGADLTAAVLAGADCSAAILSGAVLNGVAAKGITAAKADLTGAHLVGALLKAARLDEADFEGASLRGCQGDDISGTEVNFSGADLTDVKMPWGRLPKADFSNACLDKAVFSQTDLMEASFHGAAGEGTKFTGAKLAGSRSNGAARFRKTDYQEAELTAASWQDSAFEDCLFVRARLDDALFMNCRLCGNNFYRAVARNSRFDYSDLTGASLVAVNLFQGSLRYAILNRCDLEGANLFAVDFYKAVFRETELQGANLKRTYFAKWKPVRM